MGDQADATIDLGLAGFDLDEATGRVTYTIKLGLPGPGEERRLAVKGLKATTLADVILMFNDEFTNIASGSNEDA